MCYDNYPENNKYHRKKIYKQPKVYFIWLFVEFVL